MSQPFSTGCPTRPARSPRGAGHQAVEHVALPGRVDREVSGDVPPLPVGRADRLRSSAPGVDATPCRRGSSPRRPGRPPPPGDVATHPVGGAGATRRRWRLGGRGGERLHTVVGRTGDLGRQGDRARERRREHDLPLREGDRPRPGRGPSHRVRSDPDHERQACPGRPGSSVTVPATCRPANDRTASSVFDARIERRPCLRAPSPKRTAPLRIQPSTTLRGSSR